MPVSLCRAAVLVLAVPGFAVLVAVLVALDACLCNRLTRMDQALADLCMAVAMKLERQAWACHVTQACPVETALPLYSHALNQLVQ